MHCKHGVNKSMHCLYCQDEADEIYAKISREQKVENQEYAKESDICKWPKTLDLD